MRKRTVEETRYFHINDVKDHLDNKTFIGKWANGESVGVATKQDYIILAYRMGKRKVKTRVNIDKTKVGYGLRTWFNCPSCNKRTAKLYIVSGYFACRKCHDLTYTTCQKSGNTLDYLTWKIRQQQRKLGMNSKADIHDLPIFKPKYMRWETFQRERQRLEIMIIQRVNEWLKTAHV